MAAPKYIRHAGKRWGTQEERKLGQLARQNTPTRVIGPKLGRPEGGVYAKAAELGIICSLRIRNLLTAERLLN